MRHASCHFLVAGRQNCNAFHNKVLRHSDRILHRLFASPDRAKVLLKRKAMV